MSPGQYVGKTNIGKIIKLHEGSNEEKEQSRKEMAEGKAVSYFKIKLKI